MTVRRFSFATLAFLVLSSPALAITRKVEKSVPLDADGKVSVDTYKGTVHVAPWEKAEVSIQARIEPDSDGSCGSRRDEDRWVEDTRIEIRDSARKVSIKSDYGDLSSHRFWGVFGSCMTYPFVHYEIRMPRTAQLSIKDYKSTIDVKDLAADVRIDSYKGTIALNGLDGSFSVTTYKGEAKVDVVRMAGASRAETYKGDVTISLPKDAAFELDGRASRRGEVRSDFDVAVSRSTSRRSSRHDAELRGPINGGGPRLSLETYKGTVRVTAR
jgi:hypothetical protein